VLGCILKIIPEEYKRQEKENRGGEKQNRKDPLNSSYVERF
jgi:hypothetical protein